MRVPRLLASVIAMTVGARALPAQDTAIPHAAATFLSALEGRWLMRGHVRGEPVEYRLRADRTLAGRFLELHMVDAASPPAYEARVFIGPDTSRSGVLVHWLDSFGAAFSVPHGVGQVRGDTLQFLVAYPDGPFRDTIVRDRASDTWRLTIESSDGPDRWRPFAAYDVMRVPPR